MKFGLLILASIFLFSCGKENSKSDETPYFEGEIKLSESQGIYGSLFKVHTTYWLSENSLKREQKLGGLNSIVNSYAGILVDLEKDKVVLYYSDRITGKFKHTTTLKQYKALLDSFPRQIPSPIDRTFSLLPSYKLIQQKKDSTEIKGFKCDYSLYKDSTEILKQEVFDTKEIKVKRELLEIVFENLPKEINFPLKSELKTTISDVNNDSIISGEQSKEMDKFVRSFFKTDSTQPQKKSDLEKLSKNSWLDKGLNLIKKGVDMSIEIVMEVNDFDARKLKPREMSLPSDDFVEIADFGEFLGSLPQEGSADFDD